MAAYYSLFEDKKYPDGSVLSEDHAYRPLQLLCERYLCRRAERVLWYCETVQF